MRKFLYKSIIFISRKLGLWVFVVYAWTVATGFFLLFPLRVRNSVRLYRALYPDRNRLFHLWCAWRQFHNFTDVFMDRFLLQEFDELAFTSEGFEHFEKSIDDGNGCILLMSHMGNWDVAAHLLKRKLKNIRLLLYMGVKQKEQIEQIQKESLSQSGIQIIAVEQDSQSPMDILEGIRFIESGGVVSLTGDLVWKRDQRTIPVKFLGQEILLPEAPHLFALLSGAPLFIFFAFRTGKNKYRFTMSEPIYLAAVSRQERAGAIQRSAQQYAAILEATLRNHPLQWYHFRPFLKSHPEKPTTAQ
ncbi:MAG: lysophospholipid acyltransferase family protein [Deltaproteobacteria bacterium]|nr:lysophospholipid acyltransferase family protein [Deltaproteobacteria bacterium]